MATQSSGADQHQVRPRSRSSWPGSGCWHSIVLSQSYQQNLWGNFPFFMPWSRHQMHGHVMDIATTAMPPRKCECRGGPAGRPSAVCTAGRRVARGTAASLTSRDRASPCSVNASGAPAGRMPGHRDLRRFTFLAIELRPLHAVTDPYRPRARERPSEYLCFINSPTFTSSNDRGRVARVSSPPRVRRPGSGRASSECYG